MYDYRLTSGVYVGSPSAQRGYERRGRFAGRGPKGPVKTDRGAQESVDDFSGVREVRNRLRVEAGEGFDDERSADGAERQGACTETGASDGQRAAADRKASH